MSRDKIIKIQIPRLPSASPKANGGQARNKQIPITNDQNSKRFKYWNLKNWLLFVSCFLFLGIFGFVNNAFALTGSFVPGKYGSAYDFRASDTIDIGTDVFTDVRTVSFWVKLNSTTASILELRGDTYVSASAGTLSATGFTSPTIYVNGIQTTTIAANSWQYVAVTTGTAINAAAVSLGTVGAASLNGALDDVRFYNYTRTQKQIMQDMSARGGSAYGGNAGRPGQYVGYWDFNEGQGAVAFDKSGNNNDGTITGADWTMNGKFGRALDFDGTNNDKITVTHSSSINVGTANDKYTVSSWIKTSATDTRVWIGKVTNLTSAYPFYCYLINSGVNLRCYTRDSTTTNYADTSTVNDNNWHHVVLVVNKEAATMRMYTDGVAGTSATLTNNGTFDNASSLLIGIDVSSTYEWNGLIDEVKIYPFALTPAEIKQEYNRGAAMVLGSPRNSSSVWDDGGFGGAAPVAIWKMDEKANNTCSGGVNDVCDTSANSNDGAITGAVWKSAGECHQGSCLSFDGTDDLVDCGDINTIDSATALTVEAWVKVTDLTDDGVVLAKDVLAPGSQIILWRDETGGISGRTDIFSILVSDGSNNARVEGATNSSSDNNWHHIVATFIAGSTTGLNLYIDGVKDANSPASTASISALKSTTNSLQIGKPITTANVEFTGLIDDVRIYNYARTAAQIAWDYNRGKPKLHWKFDENTGATAYDYYKTKNGDLTAHAPDWTGAADQCKFNYCMDFTPGNLDYVDVGDTGIGANLQAVSFWIYPDSITSQNIIDFDNGTHKITTDASGNLTANGWSSPTYYKNGVQTAAPALTISTWQHIMITTATAFNPNDVDFGRVGASYFDGKLDEIKFYTYPLTAGQVKQDYQGGAVRIGPGSGLP